MDVRPLTQDDLSAATQLSTQAGWNQLEADWRRLHALSPDGCFGGFVDGRLVATGTALCYDARMSWIGMVLVERRHRRRGYGRRLFERALAYARTCGTALIGLDATRMGRPLYRQHGFIDQASTTRWGGVPASPPRPDTVRRIGSEDLETVLERDAAACGWRRDALLRRLLSEPRVAGFAWRPSGGGLHGHALLRPGREAWQLGPVVADDADGISPLLAAAASVTGADRLVVDVVTDAPHVHAVLTRHGLRPDRRLVRMVAGDGPAVPAGDDVLAAAGLELG